MKAASTGKTLITAARRHWTALMLVLPAVLGIGSLAVLHLRAYGRTYYAEYPYYANPPEDPYILGDAMLVQKPYTGEIFLIDIAGRRAEVYGGSKLPGLKNMLPVFKSDLVMAARGKDGAFWLLHSPSSSTARLVKGGMDGFQEQAVLPVNDGFQIVLQEGKEPGLLRYINGDGEYFSALPYGGKSLEWKKRCGPGPGCNYPGKDLAEEFPGALLKGNTLIYGKERWQVPGSLPFMDGHVKGIFLKKDAAFIVPAENKKGEFNYLCRAGAKPQPAWQGYRYLKWLPRGGIKTHVTPGGAIWWGSDVQSGTAVAGTWKKRRIFLIANEEGTPLPPVEFPEAMLARTGADDWESVLLRASGNDLWFNLAGKYMAKLSAADPGKFELWKFPAVTMEKEYRSCGASDSDYALSVRAVSGGAMMTALDGVYLMDWAGALTKLY